MMQNINNMKEHIYNILGYKKNKNRLTAYNTHSNNLLNNYE